MSPHKGAGTIIAVLALCVIAALTLTPDPSSVSTAPSLCLGCGPLGGVDVVLNILLFIPLGLGLRLRGLRRWAAFCSAVAVTVTVEALQIHVIAGRDASLGDVVSNSVGGFLGILLAEHGGRMLVPSRALARKLMVAGAIGWLGLIAFGGWAVRPSLADGPYRALWAPDLPQIELFGGRVIDAALNDEPILAGAIMPAADSIRERVQRTTIRIDAHVVPAIPTFGLAPIVALASRDDPMAITLGQDGRSLVLAPRLNSGKLNLRMPEVVAEGAFPPGNGSPDQPLPTDTMRISGTVTGGRHLSVEVVSWEGSGRAELDLDPFLLWDTVAPTAKLLPFRIRTLSLLWAALLVTPLAYWTGCVMRTTRARGGSPLARLAPVLFAIAVVVTGLALVPPLLGFPVARLPLWIAALAGGSVVFAVSLFQWAPRRASNYTAELVLTWREPPSDRR